jgi:hypothetical protein
MLSVLYVVPLYLPIHALSFGEVLIYDEEKIQTILGKSLTYEGKNSLHIATHMRIRVPYSALIKVNEV